MRTLRELWKRPWYVILLFAASCTNCFDCNAVDPRTDPTIGGVGQRCARLSWPNQLRSCDAENIRCVDGACDACGGEGQVPCTNAQCSGTLNVGRQTSSSDDTCMRCGNPGEVCCPNSVIPCPRGGICNGTTNICGGTAGSCVGTTPYEAVATYANGCFAQVVRGIGSDDADARLCTQTTAASQGLTLHPDVREPVTGTFCLTAPFSGTREVGLRSATTDGLRQCANATCGGNCISVSEGPCGSGREGG